jgi:hypothetical protein
MTKTLIIYKTNDLSTQGWEERKLMPSGNLTDTLAEEIDFSGRLPKLGDRVREYTELDNPGGETVHGRDGDWLVSRIEHFSSFDTDTRIVLCYCQYQPIEADWKPLKRGKPMHEMLGPMPA